MLLIPLQTVELGCVAVLSASCVVLRTACCVLRSCSRVVCSSVVGAPFRVACTSVAGAPSLIDTAVPNDQHRSSRQSGSPKAPSNPAVPKKTWRAMQVRRPRDHHTVTKPPTNRQTETNTHRDHSSQQFLHPSFEKQLLDQTPQTHLQHKHHLL